MRALLILFLFAPVATSQTPETDAAVKAKLATLKFLGSLYDAESGGYSAKPKDKPSLRATNAAVKATKYLGGKLDDKEKTAKYVLGCYADKTGAFAEPGGKPDVTTTCIGVMAAMELGIAKEKIAKAPEYITTNARDFEGVRIGAAAVEAWGGVKAWPNDLEDWKAFGRVLPFGESQRTTESLVNGQSLVWGSIVPLQLRLGLGGPEKTAIVPILARGQRQDGGWGKKDFTASDMESCYRVMRAFYMLKTSPTNPAKLREFIAKHRNDDGGYAAKPGEKSSAGGTYYAVIVTKWLDELEK